MPLVVPEVNGTARDEHDGIIAESPTVRTIQLTVALKPLARCSGARRVRITTYQSASGRSRPRWKAARRSLRPSTTSSMDWEYDGVEFDEEAKLRQETLKILELPATADQRQSACACRSIVGHAEAVWVETEDALSSGVQRSLLAAAPGISHVAARPTPGQAAGRDDVLVGPRASR